MTYLIKFDPRSFSTYLHRGIVALSRHIRDLKSVIAHLSIQLTKSQPDSQTVMDYLDIFIAISLSKAIRFNQEKDVKSRKSYCDVKRHCKWSWTENGND
jgi:hypothetical protein